MLNLPVSMVMRLKGSSGVLILGSGGDYDVYSGIPIHHSLNSLGVDNIHLANFSKTNWEAMSSFTHVTAVNDHCVGLSGLIKGSPGDFPEAYLASWMKQKEYKYPVVWAFKREVSVMEYSKSLSDLVQKLGVDTIILVSGGVSSIMTANEEGSGDMFADTLTLSSINSIDVRNKFLICSGFSTETEEKISHYRALENISKMMSQGGYFGSCSLAKHMESYKAYSEACNYAFSGDGHAKSRIQSKILSSVEGEFGDHQMFPEEQLPEVFINPLMSLYWFFEADAVIYNNTLVPIVSEQNTFYDVVQVAVPEIKNKVERVRGKIDLT